MTLAKVAKIVAWTTAVVIGVMVATSGLYNAGYGPVEFAIMTVCVVALIISLIVLAGERISQRISR